MAGWGENYGCPTWGPGIFLLFNEEVIQLAWISLSASFIRGTAKLLGTPGGMQAAVGTRDGMGGQIVKQIRRGGGSEQEGKKTEKGEMRPRRRKSSTETMQTEMAGAAFQAWCLYCAPRQPNQVPGRSGQAEWRCTIASHCNKQ